jgi:hypothetical protein
MTRYRTIVADPPWHYSGRSPVGGPNGRAAKAIERDGHERGSRDAFLPYGSMSTDEIKALPVHDLANQDARTAQ